MTATMKVTNLQNESSATPNIVLNADGTTTIPTQSTTNLSYTGTLTGGTGVINIGSGQVYKDASGNVGIGGVPTTRLNVVAASTNNLSAQLAVGEASNATGKQLQLGYNTTTSNAYIQAVHWGTGYTSLLLNASGGNVGIGTASPQSRLHVVGVGDTTTVARFAGPAYGVRFQQLTGYGFRIHGVDPTETNYQILDVGGSQLILSISGNENARLSSNGDFLVGTTVSQSKFCVVGNGGANPPSLGYASGTTFVGGASSAYGILSGVSGSGYGWMQVQRTDGNATAYDLLLQPSGGSVGIGTNAATYRLDVVAGNATAGRFYTTGDINNAALRVSKSVNDTSTANRFIIFTINNDGNGSGQINANGTSQAAFGTFSDRRLKTNIADLPPQLANIMALRPVEFDYIESMGGGHQICFIAQEFEEVYPDAVGEDENGMKTLTGWGKTEARLVKAIQEQQAIITQLQADVAALKGAA